MSLLYKNAHIIVGDGTSLQGDILISNHIIKKVAKNIPNQSEFTVINLEGKTIMPGLIDCHVHICRGTDKLGYRPDPLDEGHLRAPMRIIRSAINAKTTLEAGYTTIRDCGGFPKWGDFALKKAIDHGLTLGPRLLVCGGAIAMTGGHGCYTQNPGLIEVDGVDEARKAARENLKMGVDVIKIMASRGASDSIAQGGPELTVEEMKVICDEAHKQEVRCAAHAVGSLAIKNTILAGIDSIEHGQLLDDELIEMMLERNVCLVATIWIIQAQAELGGQCGYPDKMEPSQQILDRYPESIKKAMEAGITIGLGSDAGMEVTPHGENARELVQMVERIGVTPMEAISMATRGGSLVLGLDKEIGTVEEGKKADILIVNGDPSQDIALLLNKEKILQVLKEGDILVNRM